MRSVSLTACLTLVSSIFHYNPIFLWLVLWHQSVMGHVRMRLVLWPRITFRHIGLLSLSWCSNNDFEDHMIRISSFQHSQKAHLMNVLRSSLEASDDPKGNQTSMSAAAAAISRPYMLLKLWKLCNEFFQEQRTWPNGVTVRDHSAPWFPCPYGFGYDRWTLQ